MDKNMYEYWLSLVDGIGPRKFIELMDCFQEAEHIYHANQSELIASGVLRQKEIGNLMESRDIERIVEQYEALKQMGVRFIGRSHPEYPPSLHHLYDPPIGIYVRGRLPRPDRKSVAIVGARKCSEYGRNMAQLFGQTLARAGIQVISGLALGVDGFAHGGALSGGGDTFGVLGCGIDRCYPKEHIRLCKQMIEHGGVISEYPPDTETRPGLFPMRNRIIMGLADLVLVVEARGKSGSLITAQLANEYGKDVCVVCGRISDPMFEGCRQLALDGAKVVVGPEDVIADVGGNLADIRNDMDNMGDILDTKEKMVYACLCHEPRHTDEIVEITKLSSLSVIKALISLECKELCRQVAQNYYVKNC